MPQRVDAHHHLWSYSPAEYDWIVESMPQLRHDFLPGELQKALLEGRMDGAVAVQARQTIEETNWLLQLAATCPQMLGVVGWAPIASPEFPHVLEEFAAQSKLKGLRHVIQDEPDDDFILGREFNAGVALLKDTGLVYDVLIFEKHLPQTIEFVDRHPQQTFVLDHVAKPRIKEGLLSPWRKNIRELARRPNVCCKVSGMVTEADWQQWTSETLRPYLDTVLEAFGPQRLMFGSDWPVCLLAASYGRWVQTAEELMASLSASERQRVMGGTAAEIYHLDTTRHI